MIRGKPLKNQTKEVIQNIYRYFYLEIDRDPNSTVKAEQLVTHATGISMYALKRVLSENKAGTSRKKKYSHFQHGYKRMCNDSNAQAIRRTIHNFYTRDEEFRAMKDLYLIFKADVNFKGSLFTFSYYVAKLGFKWIAKLDSNGILLEKHEVRFNRIQYLTKLDIYRIQERNIVYVSNISVESSRLSSKPKQGRSSTALKRPAKSRFIIFLAGDNDGVMKNTLFVCNATKMEFKEDECKRDNLDKYEKWIQYQLIPILKSSSVVVIDSGSAFNNHPVNAIPNSYSSRKEMMEFLLNKDVPHTSDMLKPQLYNLVLTAKDKYCDYKTDALLKSHRHTVVRLPPYYTDLNPINNVLSTVKSYIGEGVGLSAENIMKISKERVSCYDDWKDSCKMTEAEKNNLKAVNKVIDDMSESIFRSVDESSSDTDCDIYDGSDEESD